MYRLWFPGNDLSEKDGLTSSFTSCGGYLDAFSKAELPECDLLKISKWAYEVALIYEQITLKRLERVVRFGQFGVWFDPGTVWHVVSIVCNARCAGNAKFNL